MELVPMTVFTRQQSKRLMNGEITTSQFISSTVNYAVLLEMPIQLWMFMPCDLKGKYIPRDEFRDVPPTREEYTCVVDPDVFNHELYQYNYRMYNICQNAMDKMLFHGFKEILHNETGTGISNESGDFGLSFYSDGTLFHSYTYKTLEDLVGSGLKINERAFNKLAS